MHWQLAQLEYQSPSESESDSHGHGSGDSPAESRLGLGPDSDALPVSDCQPEPGSVTVFTESSQSNCMPSMPADHGTNSHNPCSDEAPQEGAL